MSPTEDPIDTEAALADAFQSLLRRAHENDVDVEGGWACRSDDHPDWDVVVTEVEKRPEGSHSQPSGDSVTVDD